MSDAWSSCSLTEECKAVICPSPEPYLQGDASRGITGPVCQLRSHNSHVAPGAADEHDHDMCK
eukprot:CAMPEP_0182485614 /NCGR_PEP_ID=MMETSP1319-20130603/45589_1 /TAXON_ID=172717 /ORGANISM="Bolidomonas pacifica, Strain RCC208" /LENGTH=62 /DNA_ID=CAMNT_0024687619 /DNA_START=142 /DNA_END=327 /DNA_ORIENTATION=-